MPQKQSYEKNESQTAQADEKPSAKKALQNVMSSFGEGVKDGVKLSISKEGSELLVNFVKSCFIQLGCPEDVFDSKLVSKGLSVLSPIFVLLLAEFFGEDFPGNEAIKKIALKAIEAETYETVKEVIDQIMPLFLDLLEQGKNLSESEIQPLERGLQESSESLVDSSLKTEEQLVS